MRTRAKNKINSRCEINVKNCIISDILAKKLYYKESTGDIPQHHSAENFRYDLPSLERISDDRLPDPIQIC